MEKNLVCATPPTPLDGFCSYPHTVTSDMKIAVKIGLWMLQVLHE